MVPNFSFGAGKDRVAERNVLWGSKLCGGGGRGKSLLCSSGPCGQERVPTSQLCAIPIQWTHPLKMPPGSSDMVAHTLTPSTCEEEAGGSL